MSLEEGVFQEVEIGPLGASNGRRPLEAAAGLTFAAGGCDAGAGSCDASGSAA